MSTTPNTSASGLKANSRWKLSLDSWAVLLAFLAALLVRVGLFQEMRKQGLRPFAVGAIGEVVIAGFTLGLVYGASKLFGW